MKMLSVLCAKVAAMLYAMAPESPWDSLDTSSHTSVVGGTSSGFSPGRPATASMPSAV